MVTLAYNLSLYNVLLTSSTMMCCLLSMTSVLLERRATLHRSQTLCCHFSVSERSIIKVRFVLRQRSVPSSDDLPRPKLSNEDYNFSFSGLKSAVINLHNQCNTKHIELNYNNLAASFQQAVIDCLVTKTVKAAKEFNVKQVVVAGGVSANKGLRNRMKEEMDKLNIELTVP